MTAPADVRGVVEAARSLGELPARDRRWTHLSLCVLDAVFSIGARYSATTRTVWSYAHLQGLPHVLEPAAEVAAGVYADTEEPVSSLRDAIARGGPDAFAAQVQNRQRTSPRGGVPKAQATHDYAAALADCGVLRLADVPTLLTDPSRLAPLETQLSRVPGHGAHGVRMSYLWMLSGDDDHIKPDRMVLGWLHQVLGRAVAPPEATALLSDAAAELRVTPWQLDHAVWNHRRGVRAQ
ncbi:hypothetical protein [Nocardioides halotolerans]|uniref:hypothetical protein n=1 Tax=Nocardioides halotolerans TaxID=433660 RepID=UPI00041F0D9F|nr:hypothetical protein [Nocardioides halotolerans]